MKIILDTNVLLSALIRDSITRHLIISLNDSFYYPAQSFDEILRNKNEVLEKAGFAEQEFELILLTLFKHIYLVKSEELKPHLKRANRIIGHIHSNDVVFIAAAFAKDAVVWSNDAHFQKQKEIGVVTTKDMIKNYKKLIEKFSQY